MHMDLSKDQFDLHSKLPLYRWSPELIMVQSCSQQHPISSFDTHILNQQVDITLFNLNQPSQNQDAFNSNQNSQVKFSEGVEEKNGTATKKPKSKVKSAMGCQCKKTECIKSYCQCYSKGNMCCEGCSCLNCKNKAEHKELVQQIKKKKSKDKANESGHKCQCNKSRCLKKYCECYNAGVPCGIYCKCDGCQNAEDQTEHS